MSGPIWMVYLSAKLKKCGHQTVNWGYRSWLGSIQKHATDLNKQLTQLELRYSHIHIVAHSMGCIVTRVALQERACAKLGRVIFLTPPHQGSPIARCLGPWVRWICPAALQLSSIPGSFVRTLPNPKYSYGTVEANWDFIVPRESTFLKQTPSVDGTGVGELFRQRVSATHAGVLFSRSVARRLCDSISEFNAATCNQSFQANAVMQ